MHKVIHTSMILSVLMFLTACGNSQDRDAVYKEAYIDGVLVEGVRSKLEGTSEGGQRYEGRFDKDTGRIIEGKIIFPNGRVHEGSYDKDTGYLLEGKMTLPDGKVIEGKWEYDQDRAYLVEGKIIFINGEVHEGSYDQDTGRLVEGKIIFPNGSVHEGKWEYDQDTGYLVEGKKKFLDGEVHEGSYDKDTGRLVEGKIIFPNGSVHEGKWEYDQDTGYLVEGKITTPDGQIYEGKWDKDTGKQTHRTETLSDGAVIKGIIDEGGTIKEGTYLYINGNKYTGTLKNNLPHGRGTINYKFGTSWSGGFINGKPIILNTTDNIYTFSPDDQKMIKSIQISTENEISSSDSYALKKYNYINASNALCNSPEFGPVDKLREDWVGEVENLSMKDSGEMSVQIRINDIGNKVVDFSLDEKLIDSTVYLLEEEGVWDVTAGDAVVFSGYLEPGNKSENECINSTNRDKRPSLKKTTFTFTFTDIKKL
ncbi:hypothetical protein N9D68_00945 [Gammaproteobacteria bacterium]|nr:hypothetical protein [Gammaproteobacteria bacterium]